MKITFDFAQKALILTLALAFSALAGSASAQSLTTQTGGTGCTITSFVSSPATVGASQTAMLSWTTSDCISVTMNGGSFTGTQFLPQNGQIQTGPLSGTTVFILSANGSNGSTTAHTTVAVTDSTYPYAYTCGTASTNPDPNCGTNYQNNFVTTAATNVGSTTAQFNGLALNTLDSFNVYFEYGTTPNLGQATVFQSLGNVTTFHVSQVVSVFPATRYYFRMVSQIVGGPTIRGNTLSFTTAPTDTNIGSVTNTSTTGSNTTGPNSTSSTSDVQSANSTSGTVSTIQGVQVTVTDKSDKIQVGDTVEYTINYTNGTANTLKNATMTIAFPLGFTVKQTTQGTVKDAITVVAPLGTLAPGQTGSIFVEALVGPNTALGSTLVTSATLDYPHTNGTHDSAVGYVINHASAENALAGFALGSGFFPSTLFGWLITIIIILTIILIARRISKQKHAGGHGDTHH